MQERFVSPKTEGMTIHEPKKGAEIMVGRSKK